MNSCGAGTQTCIAGSFTACIGRPPTSETCNGVDDDCNGLVDDGLGTLTCGIGACVRTVPACAGGVAQTCTPAAPSAESCNNLDDDCNGSIDDNVTQVCSTVCGAGTRTCAAGMFGACVGRTPTSEVCNGVDDDCNGASDEGLGNISCGTGACQRTVAACIAGAPQTCSPGAPAAETCNNVDDNCNGSIDEGVTRGCTTTCGSGTQTCNAGAFGTCVARAPTAETCNGIDDDCNGMVDDGLGSTTCGTGSCQRTVQNCQMGTTRTCVAGAPGTETCNGADDNCNGAVDEGVTQNCSNACGAGTQTCVSGSFGACVGRTPVAERCNGVDDDCNGMVDDGLGSTTCGTGACVNTVQNCVGGVAQTCTPLATRTETCNNIDDDCDGLVDESPIAGFGGRCGTCGQGTLVCQSGASVCNGDVAPATEICNGRDDDCDGMTDELPLPGVGSGTVCGSNTGACRYGSFACTGGVVVCTGGVTASAEVCDGRDNNCDGLIDNGVTPPIGFRCNTRGTETTGVCAMDTVTCNGATSTFVCNYPSTYRNLAAEAYCDGLDNNCDGSVDEGCLTAQPASDLRLDRGTGNSIQPMITGETNALGVIYLDRRNGDADIFFNRSTNTGTTWGTDLRIDVGTADAVQPWLSASGTNFYGTWSDFRVTAGSRAIFANDSRDDGATFDAADVQVYATDDDFNVRVVSTGNTVAAVWERLLTDRSRQIFSGLSTDGGRTWTTRRVDRAGAGFVASTPALTIGSGTNIFAAWRDNRNGNTDIYLNRSTDGGNTWQASDTRIDTDTAGAAGSFAPSIAADTAGHVYVAWEDNRNMAHTDIYLRRSNDAGVTWSAADQRVETDPFPHDSHTPVALAVSATTAAVVWLDDRYGLATVMGNQSTDNGVTWLGTDVRLQTNTAGSTAASELTAATSNGIVFAGWADARDIGSGRVSLDIYSNYSLDGGRTYQPADVRLDQAPAMMGFDSETPFAYSVNGQGHFVWVDRRRDGITGDNRYRSLR
jgi:hypothetical protein